MPLTFVHPVAVLPFRRLGLPLSALVVGSMAPDLEFLLRLAPRSELGHTAEGLLLFCLPAGLLILWLFQRVWSHPLASLLEEGPADRAAGLSEGFAFGPLSRFGGICAAVLLGALTHVAWDSFTHDYGWVVQRVPGLSRRVFAGVRGGVPLYKALQHGSTVFGLAAMAVMAWMHRAHRRHVSAAGWRAIALACLSSAGLGLAAVVLRMGIPSGYPALRRFAGTSVVTVSAVLLAELTLAGVLGRRRRGGRRRVE